ncbi:MAG: hypothetical protein H0Z40_09735 [Desulfotomaculum sp.]|nr:hypothetical protein [Desulfotomaculum sp.]
MAKKRGSINTPEAKKIARKMQEKINQDPEYSKENAPEVTSDLAPKY